MIIFIETHGMLHVHIVLGTFQLIFSWKLLYIVVPERFVYFASVSLKKGRS